MQNEIQNAEEKYWSAMETHDYEKVKSLTQFPCLIAGSNGVRAVDETSFKKMFEGHKGTSLKAGKFSNVQSSLLSENTGVIIYETDITYGERSMKCACTSTWQQQDGAWKCVVHSETPIVPKT